MFQINIGPSGPVVTTGRRDAAQCEAARAYLKLMNDVLRYAGFARSTDLTPAGDG